VLNRDIGRRRKERGEMSGYLREVDRPGGRIWRDYNGHDCGGK
jgi:hypothetical protein